MCQRPLELYKLNIEKAQTNLMNYLPSIMLFCNINELKAYKKLVHLFDKKFFSAIKQFDFLLNQEV